jgi:hypothetical protein
MLEQLGNKLTRPISDRLASAVFYKALIVYFFLKLLLNRSVVTEIATYHSFSVPKSGVTALLYSPVTWATDNITVFLRLSMVFLVWVVFVTSSHFRLQMVLIRCCYRCCCSQYRFALLLNLQGMKNCRLRSQVCIISHGCFV